MAGAPDRAWLPAGMALLPLWLAVCPEEWTSLLEYRREAIVAGEWWRLWSGHFVHYGSMHAVVNAVLLALLGTWLAERHFPRLIAALSVVAPVAISLALLAFVPEMESYRGASGLAALLLVIWLADAFMHMRGKALLLPSALAATWAVKLYLEVAGVDSSSLPVDVGVAWQAHIAGILIGVAVWIATHKLDFMKYR